MPEGDARTRALTVRLKIEEQHRESGAVQEFGTTKHRQPIGPDAVQQNDRPATLPPDHKPAVQRRA
jgi:hypothetical protein